MNCPNRNTLSAFRTGELPEATADEIIPHISACPDCQGALQTFGDADDTLIAKLRSPVVADPYADEPQRAELMARAMAIVTGDSPVSNQRPAETQSPVELGRLGEYELLAKLGEGGMGTVYKARQTRLKKIVALKVLSKERTTDPRAVTRFEREMEAVGQLSHPNIVQAYDARDIEGTAVLVMEYVEGKDLAQVLQYVKTLRIPDACELTRQAAIGLQYAHEHGLVHRDIKPSNLMLTRQGEAKILDLGLALLGMDQPRGELTSSGQPMGTADYIAPEQVSDAHSVDIRADIYSLGCTLYKLLTGHAPFSGPQYKTHAEKLVGHLKEAPQPVQLLRTDVPAELAAVIERMMAKSPDDRFVAPAEVAAAIAPFAAGCDLVRVSAEASAAAKVAETLERAVAATDRDPHDVPGTPRLPLAEGRSEGRLAALPPRRRRWLALAAAGAAAAIFLGIVIMVSTGEGTVRIEFADADAARQCTVSVDGNEVRIENLGEPIKLRPGKHELRIRRGNLEIQAQEFDVLWRGTQVLHVSIPTRAGEIAAAGPGETKPDDSNRALSLTRIAYEHASKGSYDKATAEWSQAIALTPDESIYWLLRAEAELADGQLDAYRRHCAEMLRHFGKKDRISHQDCGIVCGACTFSPDAVSDWSIALALADRALKMCPDPEDANYLFMRGAVLYRAGRFEEALGPLSKGHRTFQNTSNPWLKVYDARGCAYMAMANYRLGHREEARKWFDKMVQQAEAALEEQHSGKVDFAWNILVPMNLIRCEAAQLLGISDAECLAINARGLAAGGEYAEAIAILRKLVHDFPDTAEYRRDLAQACRSAGNAFRAKRDYDRAIASFKEAIAIKPEILEYRLCQIEVLCERAGAFSEAHRPAEALKDYDEAIRLYADDPLPYDRRALFHLNPEHRDCDATISDLTRAFQLLAEPNAKTIPLAHIDSAGGLSGFLFNTHGNRAAAHRLKHELEQAIADEDIQIRAYPHYLGPNLCRAEAYRQKGDFERAIADCTDTIRWHDRDTAAAAQAYYIRALCQGMLHKTEDARNDLQAGDHFGCNRFLPLNALAWCLATCIDPTIRDPNRAVEVAKQAVDASKRAAWWQRVHFRETWTTLGVAQYRAGNWQEAVNALNQCIEFVSGGDPCDWLFLAMSHWQLGHKDEARRWYDKADAWMTQNKIQEEELRRFREEAKQLLGVARGPSPAESVTGKEEAKR